jgi:Type III restriction enzyme, res subunit
VASWRVMEWQPTAIFAGEALFAYLNRPLLLAEIYVPFVRDTEEYNLVGTVQSLSKNLACFKPDTFAYLIIDEAHHATGESYQRVLRYFQPRFTLGLTATPDRADGQSALAAR